MFQMSDHSERRAAQRRLTLEEIEYVLQFGKCYYCHGARVYYLRDKDLPDVDRRRSWKRLSGTAVVVSLDRQQVITVWRNRKSGLKFLRTRAQHGRSKGSSPWEKDLLDDRLFIDPADEEAAADEVALLNFFRSDYL